MGDLMARLWKAWRGKFAQNTDGTWPHAAVIMGGDGSLRNLDGTISDPPLPTQPRLGADGRSIRFFARGDE